jgi:heme-degrading monooxygenase HmoA
MVARVTRYLVRHGKVEEFISTVQSLSSALDGVKGFHFLIVLHAEDPESRELTTLSLWDSLEDIRNSDADARYYNAIKRLMGTCESFDPMHVREVLFAKFAEKPK